MSKRFLLLFLAACGTTEAVTKDEPRPLPAPAAASTPTPTPAPEPEPAPAPAPTLAEKLQAALTKGLQKKALAGASVELRRHGKLLWAGAAGDADEATHEKMTTAHTFRIASATKMFVATIIMQLVDEGKLSLDDPLSRFRPDIAHADTITITHLLGHQSGFCDYQESAAYQQRAEQAPHTAMTPNEVIAFALALPLKFDPGTGWAYANTNYFLLGQVIEQLTGAPFTAALSARILTPLGLKDTLLAGESPVTLAHGYDGAGADVTELYDPSFFWTAGAMISTAHDLAIFLEALNTEQLTSSASLKTMTTPRTDLKTIKDALGVFVEETKLGPGIGHGGNYFGYLTTDYYFADGTVITALFNTDSVVDGKALERDVVRSLIQVVAAEQTSDE